MAARQAHQGVSESEWGRIAGSSRGGGGWLARRDVCAASGAPIGVPQVVWQAAMGPDAPARGQYLFRAEGGLLQLRPGGPGGPAEWLATVAHEAFHHAQHALLVALYRGEPLAPPFDALAAYYRDARAVYRPSGPAFPPEAHRRQDLEVGAWAFGAAIAARWTTSSGATPTLGR